MKHLYRYNDPCMYEPELNLTIYAVAKETQCGWWLYMCGSEGGLWANAGVIPDKAYWTWRGKTGHFAFKDKDKALHSYLRRKDRHIEVLTQRLANAKAGQGRARQMLAGIPADPQKLLPPSQAAQEFADMLNSLGKND